MKCPVCSNADCQPARSLYDDRYGYPGVFNLIGCAECGHQFISEEFSADQLTDLYSNYYPRSSFDLDAHKLPEDVGGLIGCLNGSKSSVMYWVPHDVRILDIGCGFGESLAYHKKRGCDVHGVEADKNIRRVADKFGYDVQVGLFDASKYEPTSFDYVTLNQVIEHVTDPLEMLRGIATVLKTGGIAILSTPNATGWGARFFGKYWINWHTPYHLQFFTENSMRNAAEKAGLHLEAVKTITNSEWLKYQWAHCVTYPKMGEKSTFWTPNRRAGMVKKMIILALAIVHRTKINHLMTRIFDGLGAGDNFIFVLKK
jgi:2-polyprenyl-3-methyl-5-hydroxy-6-metoxy-1,4-benzoquinol methylase